MDPVHFGANLDDPNSVILEPRLCKGLGRPSIHFQGLG